MHEIYDPASGSERLCGPSKLLVPGRIIYPIPRSSSGPLETPTGISILLGLVVIVGAWG